MPSHGQTSPPGPVSGLLQSYGSDLKGWATGIVVRYAIAIILLLMAGAGLVGAIGVGIADLFHWIESNYGTNTAYAAVAGLMLLLSAVSALIAVLLLRRALPPVPRPRRHAKAVGRSVAAEAILAAAPHKGLLKPDATTEMMIGLAAVCLAGWLVWSRLDRPQTRTRVK
jgi:hypothetical protein